MNEKIFLTSEELQQLKDIQSTGFDVKDQFGDIEYRIQLLQLQKENLKKELGNLKEKENQLSKSVKKKCKKVFILKKVKKGKKRF